jgi:hypothetical protein
VILAFTFIPWLSSGGPATGGISERIRSTAESLEKDMEGEVGKMAEKAKDFKLDELSSQAKSKLKRVIKDVQKEP